MRSVDRGEQKESFSLNHCKKAYNFFSSAAFSLICFSFYHNNALEIQQKEEHWSSLLVSVWKWYAKWQDEAVFSFRMAYLWLFFTLFKKKLLSTTCTNSISTTGGLTRVIVWAPSLTIKLKRRVRWNFQIIVTEKKEGNVGFLSYVLLHRIKWGDKTKSFHCSCSIRKKILKLLSKYESIEYMYLTMSLSVRLEDKIISVLCMYEVS